MSYLNYLIFISIILLLLKYIIKYNIHKKESAIINYYYLQDGGDYNNDDYEKHSSVYYHIIPHNNIYESFVIIMLLHNIQNYDKLKLIIKVLRPSTHILSHLMIFVIFKYNSNILRLLLSSGADPNIEYKFSNRLHTKAYMIIDDDKKLPLFTFIILTTKQPKIIKILIESSKVDFDKCNNYYITPALAAGMTCNIQMLELVLKYDTVNINYHQFPVNRFKSAGNINVILKYEYTYNKLANMLYYYKVDYKLNIFELILLLQPYNIFQMKKQKSTCKLIYKRYYLKKIKNKYYYNDILDISYLLIKKGININKIYDYKKNTSGVKLQNINIPSCLDILISNIMTESIMLNSRHHSLNQLIPYMIKNGLHLDNKHLSNIYNSIVKVPFILEHIYNKSYTSCVHMSNKININKYFKSTHTINDIKVLQQLCEHNTFREYLSIDTINMIQVNLYKIRYDNYIKTLLNGIKSTKTRDKLKHFFI